MDIAEKKLEQASLKAAQSREETEQIEAERKKKMEAAEAAKSNVKTIKFDEADDSFTFTALAVPSATAATVGGDSNSNVSALAELIKSLPMPEKRSKNQVTRTEKVTVKVFLPEGPPMAVEVPKVATVGELIWLTVQQYDEAKREPPLVQLTRAYLLKMAEEDGTQEEMLLKYTDKFFNFGQYFCLISNPAYETGGSSGSLRGAVLSRDSQGSGGERPGSGGGKRDGTTRKGMGTFRGKGSMRPSLSSHGEELESGLLKVKMPDGSHTTVRLQDTDSATEVLEKCCSKRKFDPDQFHLEFVDDQEDVPDSLTVLELKERSIELVANSAVAGLDTYMSDSRAMQYEVFKVVKIKAGFNAKKQERMLGIDFDRISNSIPEESLQAKSGFAKTVNVIRGRGEGVKNDYWLMTDLVDATQEGEKSKSKQFVLTFKDAQNRERTLMYRYEAETPKMAKQIVGKLTRLMELSNKY